MKLNAAILRWPAPIHSPAEASPAPAVTQRRLFTMFSSLHANRSVGDLVAFNGSHRAAGLFTSAILSSSKENPKRSQKNARACRPPPAPRSSSLARFRCFGRFSQPRYVFRQHETRIEKCGSLYRRRRSASENNNDRKTSFSPGTGSGCNAVVLLFAFFSLFLKADKMQTIPIKLRGQWRRLLRSCSLPVAILSGWRNIFCACWRLRHVDGSGTPPRFECGEDKREIPGGDLS